MWQGYILLWKKSLVSIQSLTHCEWLRIIILGQWNGLRGKGPWLYAGWLEFNLYDPRDGRGEPIPIGCLQSSAGIQVYVPLSLPKIKTIIF